jgi:hypothetical protein
VVPPLQTGAVFVGTSYRASPAQSRGLCASTVSCTDDADCAVGLTYNLTDPEYLTGTCNTTAGECAEDEDD